MYKAELLKAPNHPIAWMEKLFQVPKGLGLSRSLYDEAKCANYLANELRMEIYLRMMKTLTKRRDYIFNVFGGSRPVFAAMVSKNLGGTICMVWIAQPKLTILILLWVSFYFILHW